MRFVSRVGPGEDKEKMFCIQNAWAEKYVAAEWLRTPVNKRTPNNSVIYFREAIN